MGFGLLCLRSERLQQSTEVSFPGWKPGEGWRWLWQKGFPERRIVHIDAYALRFVEAVSALAADVVSPFVTDSSDVAGVELNLLLAAQEGEFLEHCRDRG